MKLADRIRHFVKTNRIEPARERGEKTVSLIAGDIHRELDLDNRMPAVCEALDAEKFMDYARVTVIERSGPRMGSSATWIFSLE